MTLLSFLLSASDPEVSVPAELQEAVMRLIARTCCLDRASPCAAVARLHALQSSGAEASANAEVLATLGGWTPDPSSVQQLVRERICNEE